MHDEDRVFAARCAESPDGWPFDARKDDPLTAHRIAVTCSHPGWRYLVAFDYESDERPTDAETGMLVSYLTEYKDRWYGDNGCRARMEARPLDVDGGANGVVFRKWGEDDWGYRRQSWTSGPMYVPQSPRLREAYPREAMPRKSLVELMDHIHGFGGGPSKKWQAWKAAHADIFGVAAR